MFFNTVFVGIAALFAASAVAVSTPQRRTECTTALVQCCNSVEDGSKPWSPVTERLFDVVGVDVKDITGAVGVTCNPITAIGVGAAGCSATPVCCENNGFHGVVALGCVPVTLST